MGMNLGSEMMTRYNLAIEYGPTEQRATYIGLMNTLLAPLYAASLAGGWISDYFGYRAVFALGAFCSVAGILILLFRVRDPRFQARR
jgi:predicted MFS family arabinose efflux permease